MGFFKDEDRKAIQGRLQEMTSPVRLVFFTQELECQFCRETSELLRELSALSPKLHLETYSFQVDRDKAAQYRIDKVPATVVEGERDYGIRFYGIPSGYEFVSLLETILAASRNDSGLDPCSREKLRKVQTPVHLQVYVTPG